MSSPKAVGQQNPREIREQDYDTVVADDLRPAGNGKDCFYCGEPLGGKHKTDCVIRLGAGQYLVAIRLNATGEVRMYRYDMAWDDGAHWMWTDGNFACDCNRDLFFRRAVGDYDWPEDLPCGSAKYYCLYAELPDGTRIELGDSV